MRYLITVVCFILSTCVSCSAPIVESKSAWTGPVDEQEKAIPGKFDPDLPDVVPFKTTDSGLQYRILRKGTGEKPKPHSKVTVHYKGWLDNGKVFDSSYRRGERTSFGLNQVIRGWTEGLQLVETGGMIELTIPSKLGYGRSGSGDSVPSDATLHFLVELHEIN